MRPLHCTLLLVVPLALSGPTAAQTPRSSGAGQPALSASVLGGGEAEFARLEAPVPEVGDRFGAVSLHGDLMLVGAELANRTATDSGAAWLYARQPRVIDEILDDQWVLVTELVPSGVGLRDFFGKRVHLSEGTAFVAATGQGPGAVHVFQRRNQGTPEDPLDDAWVEVETILSPGGSVFGRALDEHDGTLVVGTREGNVAHVFERSREGTPDLLDDVWIHTATLRASDFGGEPRSFSYGWGVAIRGNTILVSARRDDEVVGNSGSVYAYERVDPGTPGNRFDDTWLETDKVIASDPAGDAQLGRDVSLHGTTFVVGAFKAPNANGVRTGGAYVFERDDQGTTDPFDDRWIELAKLAPEDALLDDRIGNSVSIHGDTVVIGGTRHDAAYLSGGAAWFYDRDDRGTPDRFDDAFVVRFKAVPTTGADRDWLGLSVSVFESTVAAGALLSDNATFTRPGSVYTYELDLPEVHATTGTGVPGTGGFVPRIDLVGWPRAGLPLTVNLWDLRGGASGWLVIGSGVANISILGGLLHAFPIVAVMPHTAQHEPGVPGSAAGGVRSLSFFLANDPGLVGMTLSFQALYQDPEAPAGFAFSPCTSTQVR